MAAKDRSAASSRFPHDSAEECIAADCGTCAPNPPEVRDTSDLWAWMNTWGDLHSKHEDRTRDRQWTDGYEQAVMDLMGRLAEMGVENCSNESWRRFTGRGR